jgi:hypothetical protein
MDPEIYKRHLLTLYKAGSPKMGALAMMPCGLSDLHLGAVAIELQKATCVLTDQ